MTSAAGKTCHIPRAMAKATSTADTLPLYESGATMIRINIHLWRKPLLVTNRGNGMLAGLLRSTVISGCFFNSTFSCRTKRYALMSHAAKSKSFHKNR
jgi:hypothetical protein